MKGLFILCVTIASVLASPAWACAPLAQGLTSQDLTTSLDKVAKKLFDEKPELKKYTNHRINWQQITAETGSEGNCDAVKINARVNVSMAKGDNQFCLYSADLEYSSSFTEKLTVTDIQPAFCF